MLRTLPVVTAVNGGLDRSGGTGRVEVSIVITVMDFMVRTIPLIHL